MKLGTSLRPRSSVSRGHLGIHWWFPFLLLMAPLAMAQPPASLPAEINGLDASGGLTLTAGRSTVITSARVLQRVNVAQPEVADANALSPVSLLVTAKKAGTTQLILWDDQNRTRTISVTVLADITPLRDLLKLALPHAKIDAVSANGAVVLVGQVANLADADRAVSIASLHAPKVVNLLEVAGGQQVMLQVCFAEVSRTATSALGVNFGYADGVSFGASNIGQVSPFSLDSANGRLSLGVPSPTPAVTIFGRGEVGHTAFDYFVTALRQNNLLRVLAQPNLVAMSGEEATFLAGGDFPVPVVQGGGSGGGAGASGPAITVEYRQFGVKLNFVPLVLGDGRIRLKMAPEVSDVDFSNAVRSNGFLIPGRRTRTLSTTVELAEGQTFVLGGLLDSRVTASKDVTPGLGDIPIIGALFRSVRYQRSETELVVWVTPRLVGALNPAEVPPAPGERWRHPNDFDLFMNQDIGGPVPEAMKAPPLTPADRRLPPRFYGQHGFASPASRPSVTGQ